MNTGNTLIHGLWIGTELSPMELLTISSFIAHGHRFKLWLYDKQVTTLPVGTEIGDASTIIPAADVFSYRHGNKYGHGRGSYAGFSDIFRYKLLYEQGGWWVDMDVTCLRPFDQDEEYVFRSHHQMAAVGSVIKCPPHSTLMRLCYDEAVRQVTAENTDWHKPIEILNRYIKQLDLTHYVDSHLSNGDSWPRTCRYIYSRVEIPQRWYCIHWQNEMWRSRGLTKTDYYHRSVLADLMVTYGLIKPLHDRHDIRQNEKTHNVWVRLIKPWL